MSIILEVVDRDGCLVRVAFPIWRTASNYINATMESFLFYVNKGYHNSCQRSYCGYGNRCRLKDTQHTLECHQVADHIPYKPGNDESKCILPAGILTPIF